MLELNPHLEPNLGESQTGFSLVELIVVIVVLGILSAYAVMRNITPAEMTVPSQAQTMASDIRHVQTLATTWGRRMRITITGTGYSVSCVDGAIPCPTFSVSLQNGVTLTTISITPLDFNSLGEPLDSSSAATSASYTLGSGSSVKTVSVQALTGFVANP